jgi:hypothetical protein
MAIELECPVDFVSVNENKIRLTALSVFFLGISYLIFSTKWIMIFLVVDFFLRSFNLGKYSLLHIISDVEVKIFSIKNKPTDIAPKRFAARIGLFFTIVIYLLNIFNEINASKYFCAILVLFAFLESFIGFCAGCLVYTFYKKIFDTKRQTT